MYGDVIKDVDFYGSVHTHCVIVWQQTQLAAQIEFGSAYVACIKVGCRMQCERSFTLQSE